MIECPQSLDLSTLYSKLSLTLKGQVEFNTVLTQLEQGQTEEESGGQLTFVTSSLREYLTSRHIDIHRPLTLADFCTCLEDWHAQAPPQVQLGFLERAHLYIHARANEKTIPPSMEKHGFMSISENKNIRPNNESTQSAKSLLAGGLAGMAAKTVVAPIDRTKILFQVTTAKFSFAEIPKVIKQIIAKEGWQALWKGNTATMIKVFPYAGIQFMTYDKLKRYLTTSPWFHTQIDDTVTNTKSLTQQQSMLCGGIAAGVSCVCTYPLDLARARLAVVATRSHQWFHIEVFSRLYGWARQGGVFELYRGISPTLMGVVPYGAIAFTINERGKAQIRRLTSSEPRLYQKLIIGAFAGVVAQSVTYPFEVIRRRMQTHGFIDRKHMESAFSRPIEGAEDFMRTLPPRTTFRATLTNLLVEEGVRGLFKGLSLNWVKGPLAISISFTTYDVINKVLS